MSEISPPSQTQDPEPAPDAEIVARSSSPWHSVIAFIVIIAVVAGIGVYLFSKSGSKAPAQPSADYIRRLFGYNPSAKPTPMISSTSTTAPAPTPSPAMRQRNPATAAVPHYQASGNLRGEPGAPYVLAAAESLQTAAQSFSYSSLALGFQLQLRGSWRIHATSNRALFVSDQGQSLIVESLIAFPGSLDDVQTQLRGSLSVSAINTTTFLGYPALNFTTRDGQQNLAVIREGKLYYFLGAGSNSSLLSSFSFLG